MTKMARDTVLSPNFIYLLTYNGDGTGNRMRGQEKGKTMARAWIPGMFFFPSLFSSLTNYLQINYFDATTSLDNPQHHTGHVTTLTYPSTTRPPMPQQHLDTSKLIPAMLTHHNRYLKGWPCHHHTTQHDSISSRDEQWQGRVYKY